MNARNYARSGAEVRLRAFYHRVKLWAYRWYHCSLYRGTCPLCENWPRKAAP